MTTLPGRLHLRNVPWEWEWLQVKQWIKGKHIPEPGFIKVFWGVDNVASCYLHYPKATLGQLQTWAEHLSGHQLVPHKPSKKTKCVVAIDQGPTASGHKQQAPAAAASPAEAPPKKPRLLTYDEALDEAFPEPEVTWCPMKLFVFPFCCHSGSSFFKMMFHVGSCRGEGRKWPYHGWLRDSNMCRTCCCCSHPIECGACQVLCLHVQGLAFDYLEDKMMLNSYMKLLLHMVCSQG